MLPPPLSPLHLFSGTTFSSIKQTNTHRHDDLHGDRNYHANKAGYDDNHRKAHYSYNVTRHRGYYHRCRWECHCDDYQHRGNGSITYSSQLRIVISRSETNSCAHRTHDTTFYNYLRSYQRGFVYYKPTSTK